MAKKNRRDGKKQVSLEGPSLFPNDSADEFVLWGRELDKQTDRGAAVLGASLLEWSVREAIRSRLDVWDSQAVKIFGSDEIGGELGFTDQCRMAYCLGLMGPVMLKDAGIIGRIRNRFAHDLGIRSFQNQKISALCKSLKTPDYYHDMCKDRLERKAPAIQPRQRFVESVITLHVVTNFAANTADIELPKELVVARLF